MLQDIFINKTGKHCGKFIIYWRSFLRSARYVFHIIIICMNSIKKKKKIEEKEYIQLNFTNYVNKKDTI